MTKNNWLYDESSLLPFLLILSHLAAYDFDNSDLDAIRYGLSGTSDEEDIWFDYQLIGQKTISIRLAHEANHDVIFYQLNYPDELAPGIELMDFVIGAFYMKPRHFV